MGAGKRLSERMRRAWLARFAFRARTLLGARDAVRHRPRDSLRYLLRSRELSNFTYELSNMDELAVCVGEALNLESQTVGVVIAESHDDRELRTELEALLRANPKRDDQPRYGYRYMYYCVARLCRPAVIVEVKTHDGLGAAVLLRALQRNGAEGDPGRLAMLDTNPDSGWLIPSRLRAGCRRVLGDATETLGPVLEEQGCDFLIDDIGFGFPQKPWLFEAGLRHRAGRLIIASEFVRREPADPPTALQRAASAFQGRYAEFNETPEGHFWPGHTQGLAVFAGGDRR